MRDFAPTRPRASHSSASDRAHRARQRGFRKPPARCGTRTAVTVPGGLLSIEGLTQRGRALDSAPESARLISRKGQPPPPCPARSLPPGAHKEDGMRKKKQPLEL